MTISVRMGFKVSESCTVPRTESIRQAQLVCTCRMCPLIATCGDFQNCV
jgi:hypothetical protein